MTSFSSVFIVDHEQVTVSWVRNILTGGSNVPLLLEITRTISWHSREPFPFIQINIQWILMLWNRFLRISWINKSKPSGFEYIYIYIFLFFGILSVAFVNHILLSNKLCEKGLISKIFLKSVLTAGINCRDVFETMSNI